MRPLVILKTGSALPHLQERRGDYEDWIVDGLGAPYVEVCRLQEGEPLPPPERPRAVVITGSSAFVTERLDWSERAARWLLEILARGVPTLGICYGHQLLAHALGGSVDFNPHGREIGTVEVLLTEEGESDPMLSAAGTTRLVVQSSHRQSIERLPPGARRLAENRMDAHQAFAIGERAWGVQFHPEWDDEVSRAYLTERAAVLRDEGLDPDRLLALARGSDHGRAILRRFEQLASA